MLLVNIRSTRGMQLGRVSQRSTMPVDPHCDYGSDEESHEA